jgi:2-iminobutanoate/2-iminopropanoate deaminase
MSMERAVANFPGVQRAGFSEVTVVNDWVMVSGQLAFHAGSIVGKDDAARQVDQCFENIARALGLVGARLADIVKLTCYLTNASSYRAYAERKAVLFPSRPPAGTTVIVAGLLLPDALLEIDAVAFRQ